MFSSFEEDLLYNCEASVDKFCESKGITLTQYFLYLVKNPHLQVIHDEARYATVKAINHTIEKDLTSQLMDEEFYGYEIKETKMSVVRIEKGANVHKLKFVQGFINPQVNSKDRDDSNEASTDIVINSNDL